MVRKNSEIETVNRGVMFEGVGEVHVRHLLKGPEEMENKGRLFARLAIPVGGEIGRHVHEGEAETFYVLKGTGIFYNNEEETPCEVGDVLYTPNGNSHALRNTGKEPLEILALILYA